MARGNGLFGDEHPVKTSKQAILSLIAILAASSMHAQTFQNLDFESATLSPSPPGEIFNRVPVGFALPGWNAYLGSVKQTQILQNDYTLGAASVDIFGPNYPAAGPTPGGLPGIIDGNYSVFLQAGFLQDGFTEEPASIAQYGTVPPGSESLQFKAWVYPSAEFLVSFDGNNLSPVLLGNGPNYALYGVDISSYDEQAGTLEFTAPFYSYLGLDDIVFSPNAVPEPSIVALTTMGGLLFGARRWFARRS